MLNINQKNVNRDAVVKTGDEAAALFPPKSIDHIYSMYRKENGDLESDSDKGSGYLAH